MLVKELMTTCVSCVKPDTSIPQIARQMKQDNIGSLPVCNDRGHVLGIVTDRDIAIRGISNLSIDKPTNSHMPTAQEIMSTNMIYATPNMNIHDAALLMSKHQIRRLPVISNQRLVGIISLADIARKKLYVDEAGDILSSVSQQNPIS